MADVSFTGSGSAFENVGVVNSSVLHSRVVRMCDPIVVSMN